MANINFKVEEVQAAINGLTEIETSLREKIAEMNSKKNVLVTFWSAAEARNFSVQLFHVQTELNKFMQKYEGYLSLLNSVITAYGSDEESFVATIKAIAAQNSGNQ